jgi:hypothetical protein
VRRIEALAEARGNDRSWQRRTKIEDTGDAVPPAEELADKRER